MSSRITNQELQAASELFSAAIDAGESELADDIADWIAAVSDGRDGFSWDVYEEYSSCLGRRASASLFGEA